MCEPEKEPNTSERSPRGSRPPTGSSLYAALREVVDACALLLPWGNRDNETSKVRPRTPAQIAIQTVLVTALAAIGVSVKVALYGDATPGAWMLVFVLLTVPLTLGTAAKPHDGRRGLAIGLICGLLVAGVVLVAFSFINTGFWGVFAAMSAGFAVANVVFAAWTQQATRRTDREQGSGGTPAE